MSTFMADTIDLTPPFRRGHRVRFANGPVMTVTGFCPGDYKDADTDMIVCAWWAADEELCFAAFHPDVLIHVQESEPVVVKRTGCSDFEEYHSE